MRDDMKSLGLNRLASRLAPKSLAAAGVLLGLALTAITPAPVAAQGMTAEQACTNDAFRLCNDAIPDRAKVGACLRHNARSLSADCRTFVVGGRGRHYAGRGRPHVRARVHHTYHRRHR
jgi:hypothetical protein